MFENHKLSLPPPSVTAEPQPWGWRGQRHRAQGSAPAPAAMNRGEAPGAKATTWPGPPGNRQGASADPKTAGHGGAASWLPALGGATKRHLYLPLPLSPFPTHTHTKWTQRGQLPNKASAASHPAAPARHKAALIPTEIATWPRGQRALPERPPPPPPPPRLGRSRRLRPARRTGAARGRPRHSPHMVAAHDPSRYQQRRPRWGTAAAPLLIALPPCSMGGERALGPLRPGPPSGWVHGEGRARPRPFASCPQHGPARFPPAGGPGGSAGPLRAGGAPGWAHGGGRAAARRSVLSAQGAGEAPLAAWQWGVTPIIECFRLKTHTLTSTCRRESTWVSAQPGKGQRPGPSASISH